MKKILGPLVDSGKSVLDQARLDGCVTKLNTISSASDCSTPVYAIFLHECFGAFEGQVQPGQACSTIQDASYMECKQGLCKSGQCNSFLTAGNACDPGANADVFAPPAQRCNIPDGEGCVPSGSSYACGPRAALGQVCSPSNTEENAGCTSFHCGSAGQCVVPSDAGQCEGNYL